MNYIGLYTLIRRDVLRIFRVITQTILSPLISAGLYIFIFGKVVGTRIDQISGIDYISFVFPGVLTMSVLTAAFMHSSSTLYFNRFIKTIEEVLVSPLSYFEILIGFVTGGLVRAAIIAAGVLFIGIVFGAVSLHAPFAFVFYTLAIAAIFSMIGILVGLWANGFEQLSALNTFVIMPLSYLGGMFYSVHMLPEKVQLLAYANPFFYFVDGMRYSMTGIRESNVYIGYAIILGLLFTLGTIVWWCFKTGWRIRD